MNSDNYTDYTFSNGLGLSRKLFAKKTIEEPLPVNIDNQELDQRNSTSESDTEDLDSSIILEKKIIPQNVYTSSEDTFYSCKFSPNDELIAAGTSNGLIHIFPLYKSSTKKPLLLKSTTETGDSVTSLKWNPKSEKPQLMNALASGKITQWDVTTGTALHTFSENENKNICLDYNIEGTLFATGGKDKIVRIYDDGTKKLLQTLKSVPWLSPGHVNSIFSVKFHPENVNLVLSAGWDKNVYVWDLRVGRACGSIFGPSTISGEALDIRGNTVLTGSYRSSDQLELWDLGTRKKLCKIDWEFDYPRESAYVFTCQFSKVDNDSIIAASSKLNQLKLFDRRDQNRDYAKIDNGTKSIFCADFANKSDFFCYGGENGSIKIYGVYTEDAKK